MNDITRASIAPARASVLLLVLFAAIAMTMAAPAKWAFAWRSARGHPKMRRMFVADGMKHAIAGAALAAPSRRGDQGGSDRRAPRRVVHASALQIRKYVAQFAVERTRTHTYAQERDPPNSLLGRKFHRSRVRGT